MESREKIVIKESRTGEMTKLGMTKKKAPVAILGGGLTGLSAATELSETGINVEVLEKQSDVGGLAKGFEHGYFIFDYGPHRFLRDAKGFMKEAIKNT